MTHDEAMKKAEELLDSSVEMIPRSHTSATARLNAALAYIDLAREIRKAEEERFGL